MINRKLGRLGGATAGLAALLLAGSPLYAELLVNGGFEANPSGTAVIGTGAAPVIDTTTISGWRFFAVGTAPNIAAGSATVSSSAGRTGNGIELVRNNTLGDSAFDLDDPSLRRTIPAEQRIYKYTIDGRDGASPTPRLNIGAQFSNGAFNKTYGWDPAANWETFGMTARSDGGTTASIRFDLGGGATVPRSANLDNATMVDATYGVNRVINGGFENSPTRVNGINWRSFGTSFGSTTVSSDAYSGSQAALLNVTTNPTGDVGLDLDSFRVAALGGEELSISLAAKKFTGADTRLTLDLVGFDSTGTPSSLYHTSLNPGSGGYEVFSHNLVLPSTIEYLSLAFRVTDSTNAKVIGGYLIDDVSIVGVPEPATLVLLAAGCFLGTRRRFAGRMK